MRTMVPTSVLRYLSSKATFSPQRKSPRLGFGGADGSGVFTGLAVGTGGSIAAYGTPHELRVPSSWIVTCVSFIARRTRGIT